MTCFMRYIGAKISAYNTMPCGVVFFVEFLLDKGGNVLEIEKKHKDIKEKLIKFLTKLY